MNGWISRSMVLGVNPFSPKAIRPGLGGGTGLFRLSTLLQVDPLLRSLIKVAVMLCSFHSASD